MAAGRVPMSGDRRFFSRRKAGLKSWTGGACRESQTSSRQWPGPEFLRQTDRPATLMPRDRRARALVLQFEDDLDRLDVEDLVAEVGREAFQIGGDAAWPMPSVIEEPAAASVPVDNRMKRPTPKGSASAIFTSAERSHQRSSRCPQALPPVPTATEASRRPCRRSAPRFPARSFPIWAWRLATLSNWLAQIAPFSSPFASASAIRPRPSRSCWGWRTAGRNLDSSAPARRSMSFFSCAWVSGMTMTERKPGATAPMMGEADASIAGSAFDDDAARHTRRPRAAASRMMKHRAVLHGLAGFAGLRLAGRYGSRSRRWRASVR